jgi:DNA-binding CsgD family transcriptional regulator
MHSKPHKQPGNPGLHPRNTAFSKLEQRLAAVEEQLSELQYKVVSLANASPPAQHFVCCDRTNTWPQLLAKLTAREQQVLMCYLQHLNETQAATHLGTKPQTVRNQLVSIRDKFNASSTEQLIAICLCAPGA